jgi:hypothetical protein
VEHDADGARPGGEQRQDKKAARSARAPPESAVNASRPQQHKAACTRPSRPQIRINRRAATSSSSAMPACQESLRATSTMGTTTNSVMTVRTQFESAVEPPE